MKDKRIDKVKQHFDLFLNGRKFKVIYCKIDTSNRTLSIKTKIFGQDFPDSGCVTVAIPSENISQDLYISFRSMSSNATIEHWEYRF